MLTFILSACVKTAAPEAAAPAPEANPELAAAISAAMDRAADPCVDFYQYACGGWIAATPLPPDRPIVVKSFTTIQDNNKTTLRSVLEQAAASPGEDPTRQKLGAFWSSCMDEAGIDARGAEPIQPYLAKIDALKSKKALLPLVAELQAVGFDGLFDVGVDSDAHDPEKVILQLWQGGTRLPEKSYYLDPQKADLLSQYGEHVVKLLTLAGWSAADAAAAKADVVAVETALAKVQWDPEQLRDANATYNKLDRAGVEKLTPGFDWAGFLAASGRPELTQINVATPTFFAGAAKVVAATSIPALKNYLKWQVVSGSAGQLSAKLDEESFRFFGQVLTGQKAQQPRWKRCIDQTDHVLGDLLAQAFVDQAFPGESKPEAQELVRRVESAFEAGLPSLAWMDDATRARAVEKARAITNKIGYPDTWRTYEFPIEAADYFGNVRRAESATNAWWLAKAEKPVDPNTWYMTAPTVNAYYNPSQNEIVFPAGILQPPTFSKDYPHAVNYGAIGMIIGHEITHGFDDEGRKFDGQGRLTEWWEPAAVEKFEVAAKCVEEQYDQYVVVPATADQPEAKLNGALTLGENIADLGGARLAYRAYHQWVTEHGPEPTLAGLSGDQQFFVALAQGWCSVAAPELQRMRVQVDPHSAPRFRVNGPLVNLPEFRAAFQCTEGQPMAPADRCEVW